MTEDEKEEEDRLIPHFLYIDDFDCAVSNFIWNLNIVQNKCHIPVWAGLEMLLAGNYVKFL